MPSDLKNPVLTGRPVCAGAAGVQCTPDAAGLHVESSRAPRAVHSEEILRGRHEIEIDHGGVLYRLRITSLGKLILTK